MIRHALASVWHLPNWTVMRNVHHRRLTPSPNLSRVIATATTTVLIAKYAMLRGNVYKTHYALLAAARPRFLAGKPASVRSKSPCFAAILVGLIVIALR